MTYNAEDFSQTSTPQCTYIANANGVISPVTEAGTAMLSPTLPLSHTLFVLSRSHKLLSVEQVTKTLNCVIHFYPHFCLLQIFSSGRPLGVVLKGGLYYKDDFSMGRVRHMRHPSDTTKH